MRLEVTREKLNPLLKRKEVEAAVEHPEEATPAAAAVQQLFAKQLNAEVGRVDVKHIFSGHGIPKAKAIIFVWDEKRVGDLSKKVAANAEEKKAEEQKEKKAEEKSEAQEKQAAPAEATE